MDEDSNRSQRLTQRMKMAKHYEPTEYGTVRNYKGVSGCPLQFRQWFLHSKYAAEDVTSHFQAG